MKWYSYVFLSLAAFLLTMGIAYAVGSRLVFIAVLLAFLISWIAYIPAYLFQTEKFYDLTGSIKYLLLTWFIYTLSYEFYGFNIGNLILATLISMWTLRLGSFLFMRVHKDGEDKRFRTIKTSASQFFLTWTLSGMWVSLCSICALTAIANPFGVTLNLITYIGIGLFFLGFAIEVIADQQKTAFRAISENKDRFITSGLWAISRHPNYLGEIILWFAIAVISFSSLSGTQYIALISPIFTYLLLVYVSGVRMLEDRANTKWGNEPEYKEYKSKTPVLFFKIF